MSPSHSAGEEPSPSLEVREGFLEVEGFSLSWIKNSEIAMEGGGVWLHVQRRCEELEHLENYKKLGVDMVERMVRDGGRPGQPRS